jgi:succinate dehydrogenase hydrophobic anchor subunit
MHDLDPHDLEPFTHKHKSMRSSHWLQHRLSLVALVPLSLWSIFVMVPEVGAFFCRPCCFSHDVKQWIQKPSRGLFLALWIICLLYHSTLYFRTMIDDYVQTPWVRMTCLWSVNIISWSLIFACTLSLFWTWMN